MVRVELLRGHELPASLKSEWARIQESNSLFDSPYFRPEFTQAAAAVCDDVWVGVLEQHGQPVGFFPFHRDAHGVGLPVAQGMSDFHGVVVRPDIQWQPGQIVRGCRLKEWRFHALIASQQQFARCADAISNSPYVDLSGGFEAYAHERRRRGVSVIDKLTALARKIERELGPLRFEGHCPDPRRLEQVLTWKAQRYGAQEPTGNVSRPWWQRMLEHIQQAATPCFAGMCSLLWAGDTLVAGHMGMRSGRVLHYWFPSFNESYARYSPGSLLLIQILTNAADLGIERVDLGQGGEDYKRRFMTGASGLIKGSVVSSRPKRAARRLKNQSRAWLRETPLRPLWHAVRALFV